MKILKKFEIKTIHNGDQYFRLVIESIDKKTIKFTFLIKKIIDKIMNPKSFLINFDYDSIYQHFRELINKNEKNES